MIYIPHDGDHAYVRAARDYIAEAAQRSGQAWGVSCGTIAVQAAVRVRVS